MILSHKHKFIFIKGMKVAGTSAEIALSQICGPDDIITPITSRDELARLGKGGEPRNYTNQLYPVAIRRFLERRVVELARNPPERRPLILRAHSRSFVNHMSLREVLRQVPSATGYEVLCVERSPYSKVMSLANWHAHHQAYDKGGALPSSSENIAGAVDQVISNQSFRRVLNVDRYRDLDGCVRVKPWRIASLASDMAQFFESRGIEPITLVNAKQGARSDSIDAAKALRSDQIATINQIFAEEFELFGWPMIR